MCYVLPEEDKQLLLKRIEKYTVIIVGEECMTWKGDLGNSGHARIYWNGRKYQTTHIVWLITKGEPVPEGLVVRHKCDNAACINIDHLELGTQKENVADAIARRRFKGTDNLKKGRTLTKVSVIWKITLIIFNGDKSARTEKSKIQQSNHRHIGQWLHGDS